MFLVTTWWPSGSSSARPILLDVQLQEWPVPQLAPGPGPGTERWKSLASILYFEAWKFEQLTGGRYPETESRWWVCSSQHQHRRHWDQKLEPVWTKNASILLRYLRCFCFSLHYEQPSIPHVKECYLLQYFGLIATDHFQGLDLSLSCFKIKYKKSKILLKWVKNPNFNRSVKLLQLYHVISKKYLAHGS